jgi:RNA polymerase sigma-70 factor (ECF subfamily)
VEQRQGLARSFLERWTGAAPDDHAAAALDAALDAAWERARAAWPGVALEPAALAAWCGQRAPADLPPEAALGKLHVEDLFLACACARAMPEAIRAFEEQLLVRMPRLLSALRPAPQLVDDTKQLVRERLFVSTVGAAPRIAQYEGRGTLEGWLRVVATRTALTLLEAERPRALADDATELAGGLLPTVDAELDFIRSHYEADFKAAFREAVAGLSPRDRNLLRFHFVEGLTTERISALYSVHRTTAMRWIAAAQARALDRTRALLVERLHLSPAECDSLLDVVRSRMQVTLSSILK